MTVSSDHSLRITASDDDTFHNEFVDNITLAISILSYLFSGSNIHLYLSDNGTISW